MFLSLKSPFILTISCLSAPVKRITLSILRLSIYKQSHSIAYRAAFIFYFIFFFSFSRLFLLFMHKHKQIPCVKSNCCVFSLLVSISLRLIWFSGEWRPPYEIIGNYNGQTHWHYAIDAINQVFFSFKMEK